MNDRVQLIVGEQTIDRFFGYSIDSQIYAAASAFQFELSSTITGIAEGDTAIVRVNGEQVLNGTVEQITRGGSKKARYLRVSGRDIMGHVVSRYLETFSTVKHRTLMSLAQSLLSQIPYVKRQQIIYDSRASKADVPQSEDNQIKPEPGQTVFELIHQVAAARGVHFYCRPDGSIVFGIPQGRGEVNFKIINMKLAGSNVENYEEVRDITEQYSRIVIVGQRDDDGSLDPESLNVKTTVQNAEFPFDKPFVLATATDAQTPRQQGRMILEQQKSQGYQLKYTVAGHAQGGHVWQPDELVSVYDEYLDIKRVLLVYGRTFTLSKNEGARTALVLGTPGVVIS